MYTPSALEVGPKSYPHTFSKMVERVSTWRGWRRNSSKQQELGARELDEPVPAAHLVRDRVKHQIGIAERLALADPVAGTPQQRPQPSLQLTQRERLDQVVVGTDVQALDPVVDRVAGGQHQHGRAVARLAQSPAHLQAVEPGHQDVQDDGVGGSGGQRVERLLAIRGEADVVVLQSQGTLKRPPHGRLVVDHEYARHFGNDRASV